MTDTLGIRLAVSRPEHCRAVRAQLAVYDWEGELVDLAQATHPRVSWWHGWRMTYVAFGAQCYVCDRLITSWSRRWPITQKAQREIEAHKLFHRGDILSRRNQH